MNFRKQLQQCLDNGNENGASEFRLRIMEEEELRKKWHKENVRRRHNYLPFIGKQNLFFAGCERVMTAISFAVELLKTLAANEQLIPVYERAKEKSVELEQKKKAKQQQATKA